MSLTGLAKQYNKVNQYMSEKILNVEGTKHEDEFNANEKITHSIAGLVHDLQSKTVDMIQPNPRATVKNLTSKVQGKTAKPGKYQQSEQELADTLEKYANDLGPAPNNLAAALRQLAEGYGQLAEIKDNLDTGVQQNFLDPLNNLENKEIKIILSNLKKLESRRLDYDCKRRQRDKGKTVNEAELNLAEEKFNESKHTCDQSMRELINSHVEHLASLKTLISLQIEYFSSSLTLLRKMQSGLQTHIDDAKNGNMDCGSLSTPSAAPRNPNKGGSFSAACTPMSDSASGDMTFGASDGTGMGGGVRLQPPLASSNALSTSNYDMPTVTSQPPPGYYSTAHPYTLRQGYSMPPFSLPPAPSDLNLFGSNNALASSNRQPSNPELAAAAAAASANRNASLLNGGTAAAPAPRRSPIQDPWELPPASSFQNGGGPSTVTNNSGSSGGPPVAAMRQNSSSNATASAFGGDNFSSGGGGLYPSLSLANTTSSSAPSAAAAPQGPPPPVLPKPPNLGSATAVSNSNNFPSIPKRPQCVAKFDFEAESGQELGFKAGQKIMLVSKIDDNWFEGRLDNTTKTGMFPSSYVQVVVPL